jgi:DNA polymerase III epsilon subunit-like protein
VPITYSLYAIHGIRSEWLETAPTLKAVQAFIAKQFGDCIFVGHGVRHDLQAIGMPAARFVDTSFFEDMGTSADVEFRRKNPKKLKELTAIYLNAVIQAKHHSSVSADRSHFKGCRRSCSYGLIQVPSGVPRD